MKYCKKCGTQVRDTAVFCKKCGARLTVDIEDDVSEKAEQGHVSENVIVEAIVVNGDAESEENACVNEESSNITNASEENEVTKEIQGGAVTGVDIENTGNNLNENDCETNELEKCNDAADSSKDTKQSIQSAQSIDTVESCEPVIEKENTDGSQKTNKLRIIIPVIVIVIIAVVVVIIVAGKFKDKAAVNEAQNATIVEAQQKPIEDTHGTSLETKSETVITGEDAANEVETIKDEVIGNADADTISIDSYTGVWYGSDRWSWEITKSGVDTANITFQGSSGASDSHSGEGTAVLRGDELNTDIIYARQHYGVNTYNEEVCAEIMDGRRQATMKLASCYPKDYALKSEEIVLANDAAMNQCGGTFNAYDVDNLSKLDSAKNYVVVSNKTTLVASEADEYTIWYSSEVCLEEFEAEALSDEEKRIAINEIYARHGRKFRDEQLSDHFKSKSWYSGTIEPEKFDESCLNSVEKYNILMLKGEHPEKEVRDNESPKTDTSVAIDNKPIPENEQMEESHQEAPSSLETGYNNGPLLNSLSPGTPAEVELARRLGLNVGDDGIIYQQRGDEKVYRIGQFMRGGDIYYFRNGHFASGLFTEADGRKYDIQAGYYDPNTFVKIHDTDVVANGVAYHIDSNGVPHKK